MNISNPPRGLVRSLTLLLFAIVHLTSGLQDVRSKAVEVFSELASNDEVLGSCELLSGTPSAANGPRLSLTVTTETRRPEAALGQYITLEARLMGRFGITRLNIQSRVQSPSGLVHDLAFNDAGDWPDGMAEDGVYAAAMATAEPGLHRVIVAVDNADMRAAYTTRGAIFSDSMPEGMHHPQGSVMEPVGKPFARCVVFELSVVHEPEDRDGDGVPDWVEDKVPNPDSGGSGDGNLDGIPDREQVNVVSVPLYKRSDRYATLAASEGTRLFGIKLLPAPNTPQACREFPYGGIQFSLLAPPGSALPEVKLYMAVKPRLYEVWFKGAAAAGLDIQSTTVNFEPGKARVTNIPVDAAEVVRANGYQMFRDMRVFPVLRTC